MSEEAVIIKKETGTIRAIFNRVSAKNSINSALKEGLSSALDQAEQDPSVRLLILEGQEGFFCTGMDFEEVSSAKMDERQEVEKMTSSYYHLLKRMATTSTIVISYVDGKVNAGGMGFVAASDLVVAKPGSTFSLSEALFGLLPANVLPFLIRRIGFHKAYTYTLTTETFGVEEAEKMGLINCVTDKPEDQLRQWKIRLMRIQERTVTTMKRYFQKLWIISDETEKVAVSQITDLILDEKIREDIRKFVQEQVFPWDAKSK